MSQVVDLVSGALRHKLSRDGVESLTPVEWHLLHVSQFLNAIEQNHLKRVLSVTPLAELRALAHGLEAIRAPEAAAAVRQSIEGLAATNVPGRGAERPATLNALASELDGSVNGLRDGIEQKLLDYAFRQPELMSDGSGAADPASTA